MSSAGGKWRWIILVFLTKIQEKLITPWFFLCCLQKKKKKRYNESDPWDLPKSTNPALHLHLVIQIVMSLSQGGGLSPGSNLVTLPEGPYFPKSLPGSQLLLLLFSHWVVSDSLRPHGLQPTRLLCPWDLRGKNTGVGCHFLLQGIFPTQGLHPSLLLGRRILYHLVSPWFSVLFLEPIYCPAKNNYSKSFTIFLCYFCISFESVF